MGSDCAGGMAARRGRMVLLGLLCAWFGGWRWGWLDVLKFVEIGYGFEKCLGLLDFGVVLVG